MLRRLTADRLAARPALVRSASATRCSPPNSAWSCAPKRTVVQGAPGADRPVRAAQQLVGFYNTFTAVLPADPAALPFECATDDDEVVALRGPELRRAAVPRRVGAHPRRPLHPAGASPSALRVPPLELLAQPLAARAAVGVVDGAVDGRRPEPALPGGSCSGAVRAQPAGRARARPAAVVPGVQGARALARTRRTRRPGRAGRPVRRRARSRCSRASVSRRSRAKRPAPSPSPPGHAARAGRGSSSSTARTARSRGSRSAG